ncbi:hypothetical protein Fmac_032262 [Flemingia macrophylla]|uniref:Uncharacterized protein n=1 Tax=Flemingia macrophylla TaxID=520843 RepID=A0ABD1L4E9_9FABA
MGPIVGELHVQMGQIVNDFDAVECAVVDLVLDGLEEVVVADGVVAGFGRGIGEEQDAGFASNEIRVLGVLEEPGAPFFVPIEDLRAQGEGGVRVLEGRWFLLGVVGADLGQDAIRLLDQVLVHGVRVGGPQVHADGAAEDQDCHEPAQDRYLYVVERLLDLPPAWEGPPPSARRKAASASTSAPVSLQKEPGDSSIAKKNEKNDNVHAKTSVSVDIAEHDSEPEKEIDILWKEMDRMLLDGDTEIGDSAVVQMET